MRLLLVLFVLLWPGLARADLLGAVRAENWAEADRIAAADPDPLTRKLVLYYRLLTPGAARSAEIATFMSESPDWPNQGLLSRRLAEALVLDRDDRTVLEICRRRPPDAATSLLRCADAAVGTAQAPDADLRRAWLLGITDPKAEAAFMRQWGRVLALEDQRRRFERLAWTETPAPGGTLARQAVRLDPAARPGAETRLALRRDDPAGPAMFAALPEPARADPGLVLDLARWYRRANRDAEAARVWTERGASAEAAAPPERQALFWDERNLLARRLLRAHDDALAYAVTALPTAAKDGRIDAEFLAGWIALRRLNMPEEAVRHFQALTALSGAAITQGRAGFWLGTALAAAGQAEQAQAAFAQAAAWPTTYYGQLAAFTLEGDAGVAARIRGAADPAWDPDRALAFAGNELARAAALLTAWGEPRRAKPFLQRLDELAADPAGRAIAARFAAELGLPEQAVAAARRAGRDGIALPGTGWPEAAEPPAAVERAVALGLIRQESSFDAQAASPAGARGLMQLMPATAAQVARRLNEPVAPLTDAMFNMRLGTTYLQGLIGRFGALPAALAAYNAGPGRAAEWIAVNGDPATGAIDPIDWIELIPFSETRNYVQRVVENVVIYRARQGVEAPHPVVFWGGKPDVIDDEMRRAAAALLDDLRAGGVMLATAESCTGGLIAATLTEIAGSSDVVDRGFVTYSNGAKTDLLGVPAELIATHGAVSQPVAAAMAEGALARSLARITVAVTGVAGPGGGSPEKPVGTVWFGCALRDGETVTERVVFPGDRAAIRAATVLRALQLFRRALA